MSKDAQQQKQYKILLIGEICEDIYIFGDVKRISPEAPVPILRHTRRDVKKGMAGNVYENIFQISDNVKIDFWCNKEHKIKKIRYIDEKSKYQIMRYDVEKNLVSLSSDKVTKSPVDYDVIVISDYVKGFLNDSRIKEIFSHFKNSKIFVDSKRQDLSSFDNCVLKLNEYESKIAFNKNTTTQLITTLGSRGCVYLDEIYPVRSVDVHDVCGAGDVFLASLVVRWIETNDMISAIKTANSCAALSVTKLGCYTLSRKEYKSLCI